ncbi:MAG: D-aminoacyl-tRNA deacylase [Planctomycetota bacterium]
MITVVQRVRRASVRVAGKPIGAIGRGLLLLVGVENGDDESDAVETARKVAALRCFPGRTPMDRTVQEIEGACLVVSQFTLAAELARGNRPSFTDAAPRESAEALYERVAADLQARGIPVEKGRFGEEMAVDLENEGPVTFVLEVHNGRVVPRGREG